LKLLAFLTGFAERRGLAISALVGGRGVVGGGTWREKGQGGGGDVEGEEELLSGWKGPRTFTRC